MVNEFQLGDLVRHKTGGPVMCIGYYDDEKGWYYCRWFDEYGFHLEELAACELRKKGE